MDNLDKLVGKTVMHVEQDGESFKLYTHCQKVFEFYHSQDCCESVSIEDITGDLQDLVNTPMLVAEESTSDQKPDDSKVEHGDSCEVWTFYKFATIKGWVDVRWYGTSNGYYSVSVDMNYRDMTPQEVAMMIKKEKSFLDTSIPALSPDTQTANTLKI